jgi:hypothetical protein
MFWHAENALQRWKHLVIGAGSPDIQESLNWKSGAALEQG